MGQEYQILYSEEQFMLTYNNEPFGMRWTRERLGANSFRYKKLTFQNEGNARKEALRLNEQFDTEQFGYMRIKATE
jgi:hypothetical protein